MRLLTQLRNLSYCSFIKCGVYKAYIPVLVIICFLYLFCVYCLLSSEKIRCSTYKFQLCSLLWISAYKIAFSGSCFGRSCCCLLLWPRNLWSLSCFTTNRPVFGHCSSNVLFVCKRVLPLGDNPVAVNKYIIFRRNNGILLLRFCW